MQKERAMLGHYVFNASAIGLGGVLTSPKRKVIPSLASVALAPSGGEGSSLVTNYDEDGVAFDRAETHVWGSSHSGNIYATRADVVVNNLDVFNQLQVDSMWASVTSIREVLENGDVLDRKFTFQAEFVGVRVNGKEIDVPIDTTPFDENASYDDFVKALGKPAMASYRELIGLDPESTKTLNRASKGTDQIARTRTICCTAVSPKAKNGFHVAVRNLGTAHFAEALIKQGRRRLTLIRLEIPERGSDGGGSGRPPGTGRIPGGADVEVEIAKNVMLSRGIIVGPGSMSVGSVEGNGTQTIP
jgi:hypothetical protein